MIPAPAHHFFTSHEVAALMQVSPSAVVRWINEGRLKAHRTPGGHRRVRGSELVLFCHEQAMPVPRVLVRGLDILVIDDEPRFMQPLEVVLAALVPGVTVELCDSPIDGLIKVGLLRPAVVLLDAFMPGMDGPEVCRRLKASPHTRDIRVLGITGRPSASVEAAFRSAGAAAFLSKPLSAQTLILELKRLDLVPP